MEFIFNEDRTQILLVKIWRFSIQYLHLSVLASKLPETCLSKAFRLVTKTSNIHIIVFVGEKHFRVMTS